MQEFESEAENFSHPFFTAVFEILHDKFRKMSKVANNQSIIPFGIFV